MIDRVCETVSRAISCDAAEARQIVQQATASFFVIFAAQPVPSATLIGQVLAALPGALLLFPGDGQRSIPETDGLVKLAPLSRQMAYELTAMMQAVRSPPNIVPQPMRLRSKKNQKKAARNKVAKKKSAKKK